MKNKFTKSLSVFLAMLMCLTFAPFAFAEGETTEEPAVAPVFKVELESETDKEAVITVTLAEGEFKCLDFELLGNENFKLTKIALNPEIFLYNDGASTGSGSANTDNGMISIARPDIFAVGFRIATYSFEKLASVGVKAADFTAKITSCGVEGKVDITDLAVLDIAIPAEHTHAEDGEWIETEASTCAKKGTEVRYCGICGEVAETRETAKKDHGETRTDHQNATCTQDGYTKVICIACGETINEIVIPASHGETYPDHKDPTCTEDGYDKVICKVCGEAIEETILPATNHKNTKDEHKDPTCTEAGYDKVICEDCGKTISETSIPATNHANTKTEHKDPTCTEAGYDKEICVDCGKTINETVIPAAGHSDVTTTERVLPTCTENGYFREICSVCKEIVFEEILIANGHGYIKDIQLATCTEDGYRRDYCTACGAEKNRVVLPKLGHRWLGWEVVTEPTYAKDGVERRICDNCGADEERSIPKNVAQPTEIILSVQETGMNFRQTLRLFANVFPEEAAYSAEIIWESSDESVATVNEYGEVYATGVGSATITAKTADGSVSATCEINVTYSVLQWIIVYLLFGWIWYI